MLLNQNAMLEPRWMYSNPHRLTKWYGHVDYYGRYIIGQWFALDSETGQKLWARNFFRPTTVCDCAHDVIVASETRSDGPWTADFGIYGIDARSGELLWVNHGRGILGSLLRCFDFVPGFTNEFRDAPKGIMDRYVVTARNRILDIKMGREFPGVELEPLPEREREAPDQQLYDNKVLPIDSGSIVVNTSSDDFVICRRDRDSKDVWRFSSADLKMYVDGNYYSYRLVGDHIYIVLGEAPRTVPIKAENPMYHRSNPTNYSLGVLDIRSGNCTVFPLANAVGLSDCRIEAVRDSRILVSADNRHLAEYEILQLSQTR